MKAVGEIFQQTSFVAGNEQQRPHLGYRNSQRVFAALVSVFVYPMAGLVEQIEKTFVHLSASYFTCESNILHM